MPDHFDLVVVGAGPGGYVAALKAAQVGARVGVVEKHHLGGTCLNYGCIPSKALLSSAETLHTVRSAEQWGVRVSGEVSFDWNKIVKHKDRVIRQLRGGVEFDFADSTTLAPREALLVVRFDTSQRDLTTIP